MKTIKLIVAILIVTFFTGGSLSAQPKGKMNMRDNMRKMLNLTEQQQTKIEALRSEHQKKMVELKADLEKSQIDMRDFQSKGNYSRNDYLAALDKVSKAKDAIAKEMANHRMDVYEQLTADQKKIFDKSPMGMGKGFGPEGRGPKGKGLKMGMDMGKGQDCPCMD